MLTLGVVIGFASFFFAEALNMDWSTQNSFNVAANISPFSQDAFSPGGVPKLLAQIAFFSGLFIVLRWWKNADPIRRTRFNLLGIGMCLIWAVIIGQLFFFPQPWAMVIAVVIAASTQIASPWLHPEKREKRVYSG